MRVLVASEVALMREGIRSLLGAHGEIEVVGEARDGKETIDLVYKLKPDIALMDINMKVMDGFEATRRLCRKLPKTRVIILTDRDTEASVVGAFVAGACGCIPMAATGADLASAIKAVQAGQWYLHHSLTKTFVQAYLSLRKIRAPGDPYEQLTDRERHVLKLLAEGRTGREVAQEIGVAVRTASNHTINIMRKLGVHSRTELVKYAIYRGIIDLEP